MYCRLEQVRTLHKQFNKWLELDFVLKLSKCKPHFISEF